MKLWSVGARCEQETGITGKSGWKKWKGFDRISCFLTQKWIDKAINLRRVNDKTIFMKVYYFSNVSLCPESGIDASLNCWFYNSLISFISKFVEEEVAIIVGDFN